MGSSDMGSKDMAGIKVQGTGKGQGKGQGNGQRKGQGKE